MDYCNSCSYKIREDFEKKSSSIDGELESLRNRLSALERVIASETKSRLKLGTFTDPRDKKTYKTIKIGERVWLAENLAYDASGRGGYCSSYEGEKKYIKKYGLLYDFNLARVACPNGWHLPSKEEWLELKSLLGIIQKTCCIKDVDKDYYGFFQFGGLGYTERLLHYDFCRLDYKGYWWTSDMGYEGEKDYIAYNFQISSKIAEIDYKDKIHTLLSVRCVKNHPKGKE